MYVPQPHKTAGQLLSISEVKCLTNYLESHSVQRSAALGNRLLDKPSAVGSPLYTASVEGKGLAGDCLLTNLVTIRYSER